MKYEIDYGYGIATLYTPYPPEERFMTLGETCFGLRKSIMCCKVLSQEDVPCEDFERLEFNGDVYIWREDGARKMIDPTWPWDDGWDTEFRFLCKYKKEGEEK